MNAIPVKNVIFQNHLVWLAASNIVKRISISRCSWFSSKSSGSWCSSCIQDVCPQALKHLTTHTGELWLPTATMKQYRRDHKMKQFLKICCLLHHLTSGQTVRHRYTKIFWKWKLQLILRNKQVKMRSLFVKSKRGYFLLWGYTEREKYERILLL